MTFIYLSFYFQAKQKAEQKVRWTFCSAFTYALTKFLTSACFNSGINMAPTTVLFLKFMTLAFFVSYQSENGTRFGVFSK